MAPTRLLLIAVSGLVLAIAGVLSAMRPPQQNPVYSVAALRAHLEHDPRAWVNRTVQVRAIFGACGDWLGPVYTTPCVWQAGLLDPGPHAQSQFLPVTPGTASPLLAALRRMPLLARLALAPRAPAWGKLGVYRVRLQAIVNSSCGTGVCVEAMLLDATPGALWEYSP